MMKSYSHEDAREACLSYFSGDELATNVFLTKYALKNDVGELVEKTPADMHRRLASEFSRIEAKYPNPMSEEEIYGLLDGFKYVIPQGSPMSAVGNARQVQSLSNCFVIPPPYDSYGSIARADENILQIQKRRGGVGIDLSAIRPRGLSVKNAAGSSDGIPIFMERFSNTTREVAQGGRRGALMETIDIRHPDIELFINAKLDLKKVTGANVSIRVTDEFMKAVESDGEFMLRWPVNATGDDIKISKVVKARELWQKMMFAAWKSAEPGILYWDTVLRMSMADEFPDKGFRTVCTNPCSELPLSAYDSCRLLLINLSSYVIDPWKSTARFDHDLFSLHAFKAQRLMDDLVDLELEAIERIIKKVESDPEPLSEKERELDLWMQIQRVCFLGRRTGTGITALGDTLAMLGLRYGSDESIAKTEQIYASLAASTHKSSVRMARERGSFPAWEPGRYDKNEFAKRLATIVDDETNELFTTHGRRNISLTTTAPAGSVSTLSQTTSGIEPVYLASYKRKKKLVDDEITLGARVDFVDDLGDKWQEYTVYHKGVTDWAAATNNVSVDASPYVGSTSADIDWIASVKLLAGAQKWTEHSISKTINLKSDADVDLVSTVYMEAWKRGIKGVTVYRDGSRDGVLVSTEQSQRTKKEKKQVDALKRPKELQCDIHRATIQGETYLVIVGLLDDSPYEVFAGLSSYVEVPKKAKQGTLVKNGKKDGVATYNVKIPIGDDDEVTFKDIVTLFDNPEHGALTRMISLSLRHAVPIQYLVEQLKKDKRSDLQSFSNVIARVLKNYIKDGTAVTAEKTCPDCNSTHLIYQAGCISCADCQWTKC